MKTPRELRKAAGIETHATAGQKFLGIEDREPARISWRRTEILNKDSCDHMKSPMKQLMRIYSAYLAAGKLEEIFEMIEKYGKLDER